MSGDQSLNEMSEIESQIVAIYGDLIISIRSFARMVSEQARHAYIEKIDSGRQEFTLCDTAEAGDAFGDIFSRPVSGDGANSIFYIGAVLISNPDIEAQIENLNDKKDRLAAIHASYVKAGGRSGRIAGLVREWLDLRNATIRQPSERIPLGLPFIKNVTRKVRVVKGKVEKLAFYPRRHNRVERISLSEVHKRMELMGEGAYQAALINLKSVSSEDKLRFVFDGETVGYRARIKVDGSWSSVSVALPIILIGDEWPEVKTLEEVKGNRSMRSDTGAYRPIIEAMGIYEKIR